MDPISAGTLLLWLNGFPQVGRQKVIKNVKLDFELGSNPASRSQDPDQSPKNWNYLEGLVHDVFGGNH